MFLERTEPQRNIINIYVLIYNYRAFDVACFVPVLVLVRYTIVQASFLSVLYDQLKPMDK